MKENDVSQQENAANIPLSDDSVTEFRAVWLEGSGETIDTKTAADYGRQLLALFNFIYKQETNDECNHQEADETAMEGNHGNAT